MASNQTLQTLKKNVSLLNRRLDYYKKIFSKSDLALFKATNNNLLTLFNEIVDALEKKVDSK